MLLARLAAENVPEPSHQLATDPRALLISLVLYSAGRSVLSFLGRESWQTRARADSFAYGAAL